MSFRKSTIYRLVCDDGHYYYGSTIQPLASRLSDHKSHAKKKMTPAYTYINTLGWDKVVIEPVEEVSCESRKDLFAKENEYIELSKNDPLCLNVNRAYLSKEELQRDKADYYRVNKEVISEKHKEYNRCNATRDSNKRNDYYKTYRESNIDIIRCKRKERYQKSKELKRSILVKKNTPNQ